VKHTKPRNRRLALPGTTISDFPTLSDEDNQRVLAGGEPLEEFWPQLAAMKAEALAKTNAAAAARQKQLDDIEASGERLPADVYRWRHSGHYGRRGT